MPLADDLTRAQTEKAPHSDDSGHLSDKSKPARVLSRQEPGTALSTVTLGTEAPPALESQRWTDLFASPRGVMILVPALVLALGVTLTLIGQLALGATSKKMAREQFVQRTTSVQLRVEEALSQSAPLVAELTRIAQSLEGTGATNLEGAKQDEKESWAGISRQQLTAVALELRDLLVGRKAVTQVYAAFPDGRFLSVDPIAEGTLAFQVTQAGHSDVFLVDGQKLVKKESRSTNYDPRLRGWYRLAQQARRATWSPPYSFYQSQHPGVTYASPVYADEEKTLLRAVVGVDFDVQALTEFMKEGQRQDEAVRSVVFTLGGVVLAYPHGASQLAALPPSKEVTSYRALGDKDLSGLIERAQDLSPEQRNEETFTYADKGKRMLASVRALGSAGPDWFVATFAPESDVLLELYAHRRSSLWIGLLSLAVSLGLSWLLARHLLQVRKIASEAQQAAQLAREQVRDLGSYRLLGLIGEGGMGEVWRARHRLLARQAAIKLIKTHPEDEEKRKEQRERFRREAQAIAGLRSRHTIALFDYGVTDHGTLFYVMELLDGIDLNSLVIRHGPQPAERVRRILMQACHSLSEAHEAKLVHRDIKPANLFLCREADEVDVVKVLDFGLVFQSNSSEQSNSGEAEGEANDADADTRPVPSPHTLVDPGLPEVDDPTGRITRANHQLGTPAFMSPEQAIGNEADARSDLYSLGCIAWWLLTAQAPFTAPSAMALMLAHIETPPPSLSSLVEGPVDPGLERLILSCLEKSPSKRPRSARELGQALRAVAVENDWSEERAARWWSEHLPRNPDLQPTLSLPPLRDVELVPPAAG